MDNQYFFGDFLKFIERTSSAATLFYWQNCRQFQILKVCLIRPKIVVQRRYAPLKKGHDLLYSMILFPFIWPSWLIRCQWAPSNMLFANFRVVFPCFDWLKKVALSWADGGKPWD